MGLWKRGKWPRDLTQEQRDALRHTEHAHRLERQARKREAALIRTRVARRNNKVKWLFNKRQQALPSDRRCPRCGAIKLRSKQWYVSPSGEAYCRSCRAKETAQ